MLKSFFLLSSSYEKQIKTTGKKANGQMVSYDCASDTLALITCFPTSNKKCYETKFQTHVRDKNSQLSCQ